RSRRRRRLRLPADPPRSSRRRRSVRRRALAARRSQPGRRVSVRAPPARVHRRVSAALLAAARSTVTATAIRQCAAVATAIALVVASDPGAAPPAAHDRIAHIDRALASVRALGTAGRDALARDLYTAARTRCHADTATPTAACLVEAGRAHCASS